MKNEFVIFVGPMFGGKTTKLLSAIDRYRYQGRRIKAYKPDTDKRYSKNEIVTHWGGKVAAQRINCGIDIIKDLESTIRHQGEDLRDIVIAVDEVFMIDGAGRVLTRLYTEGYTILASSIQVCSDGTSYPEVMHMMPWATKIEICPAVCTKCHSNAYFTEKIGGRSDHKVEVGGLEMYQPRCLNHFSVYNVQLKKNS